MTPEVVAFEPNHALEWMQFTQHLIIALIAWVTIGVYGSFYVIRSLTLPRARRRTHQEIHEERYQEDYPESNPPTTQERRRIALESEHYDDQSPDIFEDIEVPKSPKQLRLAALGICGLLGPLAVLGLLALGWLGSWPWHWWQWRWLRFWQWRWLRFWRWRWRFWRWRWRWRIRRFVVRWLLTGGPDWRD